MNFGTLHFRERLTLETSNLFDFNESIRKFMMLRLSKHSVLTFAVCDYVFVSMFTVTTAGSTFTMTTTSSFQFTTDSGMIEVLRYHLT